MAAPYATVRQFVAILPQIPPIRPESREFMGLTGATFAPWANAAAFRAGREAAQDARRSIRHELRRSGGRQKLI